MQPLKGDAFIDRQHLARAIADEAEKIFDGKHAFWTTALPPAIDVTLFSRKALGELPSSTHPSIVVVDQWDLKKAATGSKSSAAAAAKTGRKHEG